MDTSKMTAKEYKAKTDAQIRGLVEKAKASLRETACQVSAADYVRSFIRRLEDPEMRLVTEKPHDWCNHGDEGKKAILTAVKEGLYKMAVQHLKEGSSDEQGSERPVGGPDPSVLVGTAACRLLSMSETVECMAVDDPLLEASKPIIVSR